MGTDLLSMDRCGGSVDPGAASSLPTSKFMPSTNVEGEFENRRFLKLSASPSESG